MSKILLTNDIKDDKTAGIKARVDVLATLKEQGYTAVPFPRFTSIGVMRSFWKTLSRTVKKGDHIVVEYPCWLRRRLYFVKAFSLFRGIPFYGIIHDINTIRFQTSPKRDIVALKLFTGLVSHNYAMTRWLQQNGYGKRIVDLDMFDYRLASSNPYASGDRTSAFTLLYAGNLSYAKATYIYDSRLSDFHNFSLHVYGQYFEEDKMSKPGVVFKGSFNPNTPVFDCSYQFGLIWEGTSLDSCEGDFGNYVRYNNPHKFSLYVSVGLPVIVWKEAAVARFVAQHNIGLVVDNLGQLNSILATLPAEQYRQYVQNVAAIAEQVRTGGFTTKAMKKLTEPSA